MSVTITPEQLAEYREDINNGEFHPTQGLALVAEVERLGKENERLRGEVRGNLLCRCGHVGRDHVAGHGCIARNAAVGDECECNSFSVLLPSAGGAR